MHSNSGGMVATRARFARRTPCKGNGSVVLACVVNNDAATGPPTTAAPTRLLRELHSFQRRTLVEYQGNVRRVHTSAKCLGAANYNKTLGCSARCTGTPCLEAVTPEPRAPHGCVRTHRDHDFELYRLHTESTALCY